MVGYLGYLTIPFQHFLHDFINFICGFLSSFAFFWKVCIIFRSRLREILCLLGHTSLEKLLFLSSRLLCVCDLDNCLSFTRFDGFTSTFQDKLFKGYNMEIHNQIFYTTICSCIVSLTGKSQFLLNLTSSSGGVLHSASPALMITWLVYVLSVTLINDYWCLSMSNKIIWSHTEKKLIDGCNLGLSNFFGRDGLSNNVSWQTANSLLLIFIDCMQSLIFSYSIRYYITRTPSSSCGFCLSA